MLQLASNAPWISQDGLESSSSDSRWWWKALSCSQCSLTRQSRQVICIAEAYVRSRDAGFPNQCKSNFYFAPRQTAVHTRTWVQNWLYMDSYREWLFREEYGDAWSTTSNKHLPPFLSRTLLGLCVNSLSYRPRLTRSLFNRISSKGSIFHRRFLFNFSHPFKKCSTLN